jgi:phosphoribosylformylglycinamidine (FGAM) synthase-like enzyme
MGAKGGLGIELDLDQVPVREENMSAYEMMLSESQERMLMVLEPEKEAEAKAIFVKWGLDFAIVGKTTDDLRFRILHKGDEVANLPIKELGDEAPEYDRPWREIGKFRLCWQPMSTSRRTMAGRCSIFWARPTTPRAAGSGSSMTR